jgi:hypothetical protein
MLDFTYFWAEQIALELVELWHSRWDRQGRGHTVHHSSGDMFLWLALGVPYQVSVLFACFCSLLFILFAGLSRSHSPSAWMGTAVGRDGRQPMQ